MPRQRNTPPRAIVPAPFDCFIMFVNPGSTHIRQARRRIADLQGLFPDVPMHVVTTVATGREANAALLRTQAPRLGPRTLLCIAAGDGTTNLVIESLLYDPKLPAIARRTPIFPLWGGNANDLACMLNGAPRIQLHPIIERGQIVPIRPLQCRITTIDGNVKTYLAACSVSFGASAFAAKRLNETAHRHSPLHKLPGGHFLQATATVWGGLVAGPTFAVEESGTHKVIYERMFSNGSHIAKMYRAPVRLDDNHFYLSTWEGKVPVVTATRLLLSFRRHSAQNRLHDHAEFTVHGQAWVQFDGEATQIPAGAKIEITLSKRPFYALSTTLIKA
jgi:diacylglycerol kinase family enzyme